MKHARRASKESTHEQGIRPRPVAADRAASCSVCGHRYVAYLFIIQHLARTMHLRYLRSRLSISILPLNARTANDRVLIGVIIARGSISPKRFSRRRFCIRRALRYVVRLQVRILIVFVGFCTDRARIELAIRRPRSKYFPSSSGGRPGRFSMTATGWVLGARLALQAAGLTSKSSRARTGQPIGLGMAKTGHCRPST